MPLCQGFPYTSSGSSGNCSFRFAKPPFSLHSGVQSPSGLVTLGGPPWSRSPQSPSTSSWWLTFWFLGFGPSDSGPTLSCTLRHRCLVLMFCAWSGLSGPFFQVLGWHVCSNSSLSSGLLTSRTFSVHALDGVGFFG